MVIGVNKVIGFPFDTGVFAIQTTKLPTTITRSIIKTGICINIPFTVFFIYNLGF